MCSEVSKNTYRISKYINIEKGNFDFDLTPKQLVIMSELIFNQNSPSSLAHNCVFKGPNVFKFGTKT